MNTMTNKITQFIQDTPFILADGATGTNLFNAGLQAGDPPELWNEDAPDKITALYQGFVDAGSDLFLTNSFGANASRLALHKAENRVHALAKKSAELARTVADNAPKTVIVAGSMGPTGEIMGVAGNLSHESAVAIFAEQARGLLDGGADVLWLETLSAAEEYRAAAEAINKIGAPWAGTMSFDTAGRSMMGLTSHAMVDMVESMDEPPVAFGANCGVGAADLLRTVAGFAAKKPRIPIIAKGNAGIPKFVDGHIHYDGTPELMAQYAVLARDLGAKVIGGCCGTQYEHVRAMRVALDSVPRGPVPTLLDIESAMGGFSSPQDGTEAGYVVDKRARRRR